MRRTGIWVAVVLAGALGCREQKEPGNSPASATRPAAGEGAFCAEHGVLEAVCPKCNPALVPVFKARGDWCEAHGFPESFCPVCNPKAAGRPAAAVGDDGAPADGTRVRFGTAETARLAGLSTVKVADRPTRLELPATARLVYDAARVAEINARSPGVVRALRADVGTVVRAGAPLAVIESAGVGADQSRVQAARSRTEVAEANHARTKRLHAEGIAAEREVLTARQELDAATAELRSAGAALGMVGGTAEGASRYSLTAPLSGVVTQRTASIGRMVGTEQVLFEVVDTSVVWAEIDIPEADLPRVAVGQEVRFEVDGLAGRELSGPLTYLAPAIDTHTRTVKGRVSLANPDGALRANLFARAHIAVAASKQSNLVPRSAVQRARGVHLVFVRLAEDLFEARRVEVGHGSGDLVEVKGRLLPGDEVVTDGSFLLKTETLKESIGAGCCDDGEPR